MKQLDCICIFQIHLHLHCSPDHRAFLFYTQGEFYYIFSEKQWYLGKVKRGLNLAFRKNPFKKNPFRNDSFRKNPFRKKSLQLSIIELKGFISKGNYQMGFLLTASIFTQTHTTNEGRVYIIGMMIQDMFFKLLVNIGLDSDPGGAQQFVSRWYHLCSDTHPYPPG